MKALIGISALVASICFTGSSFGSQEEYIPGWDPVTDTRPADDDEIRLFCSQVKGKYAEVNRCAEGPAKKTVRVNDSQFFQTIVGNVSFREKGQWRSKICKVIYGGLPQDNDIYEVSCL